MLKTKKELKEEEEGARSGWRRGRRDPGDKERRKSEREGIMALLCW